MKFTTAVVSTFALALGATNGEDGFILSDKPYSLVFTYSGTPPADCDQTFVRLRNAIYQDYINNVVFTTSAEYDHIDRIDPSWRTVASVFDKEYYAPTGLKTKDDPFQGVAGVVNAPDTTLTGPDPSDAIQPLSIDDIRPYNGAPDTPLPDLRRLAEDADCGLAINVGRPKYGDCTLPPTDLIGSKENILTTERGGAVAEMFYENADLYLEDGDICKSIINAMTYQVLDLAL